MICSASNKDCEKGRKQLKSYFDLMFDADVQFYIGAHFHVYERIYPYCQNGTVQTLSSPYDLKNSKCMISILQGIAGNGKSIVETYNNLQPFTAKVSYGKTGFGLKKVSSEKLDYIHYSTTNILTIEDTFSIHFNKRQTDDVNLID